MQVSYYKNAEDNSGILVDFAKVLRNIKKGLWKEQIQALRKMDKGDYSDNKRYLSCVTFSGTFLPTRHDAHIQQYNQILCLDIDKITAEVLSDLQDALTLDRHVLAMFVSPSGVGLKVLVRVDSEAKDHYSAFECCRLYFKENYQIDLDISGKNLARLCFVSYDPDLFYSPEAVPFNVEISETNRQRIYGDREIYSKTGVVTTNDLEIYRVCKYWADYHCEYKEGSRNQNIFICANGLNRCGMSAENAILSIARDRVDLPIQEIKETVRKVYKNKVNDHATIKVYDFDKQSDASRGAMQIDSPADIMDKIMSASSEGLIASGFAIQDKTFGGGKERGAVYAYIGREKTYKSVHAIMEACNLAIAGHPVLYLNGEMSMRQFMQIVAQQRMAIPRIQFTDNYEKIKEWAAANLQHLSVVTGKDFTYEKILRSADAIRVKCGKDVTQVFIDGISHMDGANREEIHALIENSKVIKEVAKGCNEGRMTAVTVLIHTDSACNYWSRKPQSFIRGKTKVLSNFDGSVGFSRFLVAGSQNDDWSDFELRKDIYNVRVEDYRLTGESSNVVIHLNANCAPAESADDVNLYEFTKPDKKRY